MSEKMLINYISDVIYRKYETAKQEVEEESEYLVSYHYDNKIAKGIGEYGFKGKGKATYNDITKVRNEANEALKQKLNTEVDFNIVILNIINLSKL